MNHRWTATALSIIALGVSSVASAAPVSGQGTWQTTLQGRDLDGNLATAEAWYDTDLNITWLADANYAGNSMHISTANAWAASLNPYGSGITGWRLPITNPIDGTTADDSNVSYIGTEDRGYNVSAPGTLYAGSTASELAHLFYGTLGNKSYCDPATSTVSSCSSPQAGWGLSNTGPFSNVEPTIYLSGTKYAPNPSDAWFFNFNTGLQLNGSESGWFDAWAVHSGDVGTAVAVVVPAPVPAAAWLFASGLAGLIGLARRKGPSA
jgi:hypothetical protein